MTRNLLTSFAAIGLAASSLVPVAARADEWNKETILQFSAPVEVPGRVLPAGKYVFKLADSNSNRDIVQIFNGNQSRLITTILGIPDYRLEPTAKTDITFEERSAGAPEAIHTWFYPGDNSGVEFVYKSQPVRMAANTQAASSSESTAASQSVAPPVTQGPEQQQSENETPQVIAQTPRVDVAAQRPEVTPEESLPEQLPRTAGDLPGVELGGLSLAGMGTLLLRRTATAACRASQNAGFPRRRRNRPA
jgi:hypothetical protein